MTQASQITGKILFIRVVSVKSRNPGAPDSGVAVLSHGQTTAASASRAVLVQPVCPRIMRNRALQAQRNDM